MRSARKTIACSKISSARFARNAGNSPAGASHEFFLYAPASSPQLFELFPRADHPGDRCEFRIAASDSMGGSHEAAQRRLATVWLAAVSLCLRRLPGFVLLRAELLV